MSVKLEYRHQQKTYDLMNQGFENHKKVAYIFPVGCGKSFPILKRIEDYPDENMLIVVSSIAIKNQFIKYIKQYVENGEQILRNKKVHIITYHKLGKSLTESQRNNTSMPDIKFRPDTIVFDEIHRMGATTWEPAVDYLMKKYTDANFVGMSATPERTDERNMAEEKFDDIIYEMSLTEALSGSKENEVVLKTPRYIRVISQLKEELPRYKNKIDNMEVGEEKERLLKKYERLEETVSKFPSLEEVMELGMKKKNGKYIVFCKDSDDMFSKMQEANRIFGKVNRSIKVDYVLSESSNGGKTRKQNRIALEKFEKEKDDDNLRLLFCVDMLNEGIHLDKIDGCVMFRPTDSAILYKQQIGRVLSADKAAGETVIIDAVNNWLRQEEAFEELDHATNEGNGKDKIGSNLFSLTPEETDLLGIMKEIDGATQKDTFLDGAREIEAWCVRNFSQRPIWERRLPRVTNEDTYENKLGNKLSNIRCTILKKYKGIELNEIKDNKDRKIVEIIRRLDEEYGLSISLKSALEIENWCIENNKDKEVWDRRLPNTGAEDEYEKTLGRKLSGLRYRVIKKYEGIELNQIEDEYDRRTVEIIRRLDLEYGQNQQLKNIIEIEAWCKEKYGDKPIWERSLPNVLSEDPKEKELGSKLAGIRFILRNSDDFGINEEELLQIQEITKRLIENYGLPQKLKNALKIEDWCKKRRETNVSAKSIIPNSKSKDKEEASLGAKLVKLRSYIKQYEGMELEQIEDEEDRKIVEIIRGLDQEYGVRVYDKNAVDIESWCIKNFKDKPIWERRLPRVECEDEEEQKLGRQLKELRRAIMKKYEGVSLEKIQNNGDRRIVEIVKRLDEEYGLAINIKRAMEIEEWCKKTSGDKPIWQRNLPNSEATDEYEKKLASSLKNLHTLAKKYEGMELDEIKDIEDRRVIEIVRKLDENYGLSKSLKNALEIEAWCISNFGDKPVWEKRYPTSTSDDPYEKTLGQHLGNIKNTVVRKYANKELKDINDKYERRVVEIIRRLDSEYGLSQYLKNLLKIQNWCETNFANVPFEQRRLPDKKSSDENEQILAKRLAQVRYFLRAKYKEGIPEVIEDKDDRAMLEILDMLDEQYNHERLAAEQAMRGAVGEMVGNNAKTRKKLRDDIARMQPKKKEGED